MNLRKYLIAMIVIAFVGIMISCSRGTKKENSAAKSQYPIDERDTVTVNLLEVTDTKVIVYTCEPVEVVVSYNAVMNNLEEDIRRFDLADNKTLRSELLSLASSNDTISVESIIQDHKVRERLSFRLAELLEKGEAAVLDSRANEKINTIMVEHYKIALHKLAGRGGRRFMLPDGFLFLEVLDWMS